MAYQLPMAKDLSKKGNHPVTKEDFCQYCHQLYSRHLVTGVGGNLSVRVGKRILITPSGYSLNDMTPDGVVMVNEEGKVLDKGIPTKDVKVHLGILFERPEINVVCHVHGASIIAASALMAPGPDSLPPLTPGFVYFSYPLPMIPFMVPGTEAFAKAVVSQFVNRGCKALLLQNHGLVSVGEDFSEALNIAEEIDEAARVYVLTNGSARVISDREIEEIKSYKITT